MSVLVEVTQEDIDAGKRGCCDECAVAIGLHRRTGMRFDVTTTWASPRSEFEKRKPVPLIVQEFVSDFDAGRPVAPFRFWFPTVPHYAKEQA